MSNFLHGNSIVPYVLEFKCQNHVLLVEFVVMIVFIWFFVLTKTGVLCGAAQNDQRASSKVQRWCMEKIFAVPWTTVICAIREWLSRYVVPLSLFRIIVRSSDLTSMLVYIQLIRARYKSDCRRDTDQSRKMVSFSPTMKVFHHGITYVIDRLTSISPGHRDRSFQWEAKFRYFWILQVQSGSGICRSSWTDMPVRMWMYICM